MFEEIVEKIGMILVLMLGAIGVIVLVASIIKILIDEIKISKDIRRAEKELEGMKVKEDCKVKPPKDLSIRLIQTWHNPKKLCTYFVDVVDMIIYERDDRIRPATLDMGDGTQMNVLIGLEPVYRITKI